MNRKSGSVRMLAVLLAFAMAMGAWAEDAKPTEGGKAEEFKGKTFELKEKGKAAITLTFSAGKKVTVTVKSEKKTDVNLFVYNDAKKVVKKDDSPGPSCELTFTPKKAGDYTLEVVNLGPGSNSSTLKVVVGKKAKPASKE